MRAPSAASTARRRSSRCAGRWRTTSAEPALNLLARLADGVAAAGLFAMMMVTVVDVTGRYLFSAPLQGGFELTEYLMGVLVFLALPLVSARGEHVRISLLDSGLGERARLLRDRAMGVCTALVCCVIAWPLAALGMRMASYGDGTQTLGLPLAPLAFFMVASLVVSGLAMAIAPFLRR